MPLAGHPSGIPPAWVDRPVVSPMESRAGLQQVDGSIFGPLNRLLAGEAAAGVGGAQLLQCLDDSRGMLCQRGLVFLLGNCLVWTWRRQLDDLGSGVAGCVAALLSAGRA